MSKTDEIGATKLALSQPSLAEQLEAAQTQAEILNVMRGIVSDHRGVSVHSLSRSMLPERPTPPAPKAASRNGWIEPPKLETPHVAACDRLVDAFEAAERAKK